MALTEHALLSPEYLDEVYRLIGGDPKVVADLVDPILIIDGRSVPFDQIRAGDLLLVDGVAVTVAVVNPHTRALNLMSDGGLTWRPVRAGERFERRGF